MASHKLAVYSICLAGLFTCVSIAGQDQRAPAAINETVPAASNNYPLGSDSMRHAGVPAGQVFQFKMNHSTVFPETTRTITVYVPAEYTGAKPACLYVGLDGLGFNAPLVFDNLIAQHATPVTIAIGISPGTVPAAKPPADPRFDRSFEFDSLSDRLARFIINEVIPQVQARRAPDGKRILISNDPNDRAIGGGSTGGIGAFTVAWERPDAFRRVFSAIGTYVGMRGGQNYYVLVRKTEPKPLRIFMEDGVHDEWPGGPEMGDWWMSNQTMERALTFAGYDVRHVWGVGTHDDHHAAMVFPDAMRWLWRDWTAPVTAGVSRNPVLTALLDPHEGWETAAEKCSAQLHLASDPHREVFFDASHVESVTALLSNGRAAACASSVDGKPLAFDAGGKVHSTTSVASMLPNGVHLKDFTVRNDGQIYATAESDDGVGQVWRLKPNGEKELLGTGLSAPSGIAFSPDGLWLFVAQQRSRFGMSYRVLSDGKLDAREPLYDFWVPAWVDDSGAQQVAMDREGRAYVATRMGVQVFDRNGRVTAILPLPGNQGANGLCFGGSDFRTLFVASGGKIFKRRLRVTGAPAWGRAIVLPPWSPG